MGPLLAPAVYVILNLVEQAPLVIVAVIPVGGFLPIMLAPSLMLVYRCGTLLHREAGTRAASGGSRP